MVCRVLMMLLPSTTLRDLFPGPATIGGVENVSAKGCDRELLGLDGVDRNVANSILRDERR